MTAFQPIGILQRAKGEALVTLGPDRLVRLRTEGSAKAILADWDNYRGKFIKVFPHEYRRVLRDHAEQQQLEAA